MRTTKYTLRDNGKSASLLVSIKDRFGDQRIDLSRVRGWRKELAVKHLSFDSKEWDDIAARAYVGLQALKCAKDPKEGLRFVNVVKSLSKLELHFWASKFLSDKRAAKAWRAFYAE